VSSPEDLEVPIDERHEQKEKSLGDSGMAVMVYIWRGKSSARSCPRASPLRGKKKSDAFFCHRGGFSRQVLKNGGVGRCHRQGKVGWKNPRAILVEDGTSEEEGAQDFFGKP